MTKKKDYAYDKKVRELYHADKNTTDSYSDFKAKLKKAKNPF